MFEIWWDCVKNGMESLGLSQKDAQSRNKWRRRIKGATGSGSPGKMAVKTECVLLSGSTLAAGQSMQSTGIYWLSASTRTV